MTDTTDPDLPLEEQDLEAYEEDSDIGEDSEEQERTVPLLSSEALSDDELRRLQANTRTQTVLLVGPPEAGKTTLIAAVYEMFGAGAATQFQFGGSQTLIGLESIAHSARAMSGLTDANTDRTRPGSRTFLHLRLRRLATKSALDFILPDLPGENFTELTTSGMDSDYDTVRPFADHVAFAIDGERLVDKAQRQVAVQEMSTAIKVAKERHWFRESDPRQLVVTKLDLMQDATPEQQEWVTQRVAELAEELGGPAFRTAAQQAPGLAHQGLESLLEAWSTRRPVQARMSRSRREAKRSFDRFET